MNCKERFTSKSNKSFRFAIKNSPVCMTLKLFIQRLYKEIVNSYRKKAVDYKIKPFFFLIKFYLEL